MFTPFAALGGLAHAFCGAYLGSADAALVNQESRVVLATAEGVTTLTLAADVQTTTGDFALVLPVPASEEVAVSTAPRDLVDLVFAWSAPRGVAYSCEGEREVTYTGTGCGTMMGCSDSTLVMGGAAGGIAAAGPDEASGVHVEATFTEAGYDIVVLSAEGADGLQAWLDAEGFAVPEDAGPVLQAYIDAGVHFLAARVSMDPVPEGRVWLPPLQVSYPADVLGLPIRIGTVVADGPQDVLLVTLLDDGQSGISNYPEVEVEAECMWDPAVDGALDEHYAAQVDAAMDTVAGTAWLREMSWPLSVKCDPCTTDQAFTPQDMENLGATGWSPHLTRLRIRVDPDAAEQDLMLYASGFQEPSQLRYVRYLPELEYAFPICGQGWAEDPGECPDDGAPPGGCGVPLRPAAAGLGLVVLVLLRRRGGA